ncbi:long-chain-fatty-acid--CoA ligase 4-like [Varroa destructor]|uniref:long-chain-fatty-acid--CoA ligase n=1 Tax=Varroa destructor TaxID=109461 RepID=A0A7M7JJ61_VARDE|nr:long-chain-fatty-acid--CoA ligase 4-like [Varroa destructor]
MEDSIVALGAIGALKAASACYDVLTLPIYTLMQRPWNEWKNRRLVYSVPLNPGQPLPSGMKRAISRNKGVLDGITTMDQLMRRAIEKFADRKCFGSREVFAEDEETQPDGKIFKKYTLGEYRWLKFREVDEKINHIASGLFQTGIRSRQNVAVFAETRIEWMLTAQALLRNNVPLVTLYATIGKQAIIHGINETEVTHIITSQYLLEKIIEILPHISSLTHIIYMENHGSKSFPPNIGGINLISFSKLIEIGANSDKGVYGEVPGPEDTAIIMYTSGSTGVPKGVIITHANLVASAKGYSTIFPDTTKKDSYIAYLPLAHVMELACESMIMAMGARIGYSSPLTLTDKGTGIRSDQRGDAILLKPTMMLAVPVILDRIRKGIIEAAEAKGSFNKQLLRHAISYKAFWQKAGYQTPILNKFIFDGIKAILGGQLRVLATGSAPLSAETFDFVKACFDLYLMQGYGLTETTSGVTVTEYSDNISGTSGCPLEGVYVRLIDWKEGGYTVHDKPNPRGEIVVGGNTVSKGYYKNEALTHEVFFEEDGMRWCYTGDIGELLPDGTIRIVDRKKDLVKLQFGEYVSLGKVEAELKTSPLVENICVHGNSLSTFLVALISPNVKALRQLAMQVGLNPVHLSFEQLCENRHIVQAATEQLIRHAKHCNLNKMEIPWKIKLCAEEWQPGSGLVTAALKIRRKEIQTFYQRDLDRMYGTATSNRV